MQAELFLMNPLTTASFRPEPLPRVRAHQALALPEVAQAVPVYLAQSTWRNPEDGSRRAIQMIGFDVGAGAMQFQGLDAIAPALRRVDAVGFDTRSRPEFGDVAAMFAERGPVRGADRQPRWSTWSGWCRSAHPSVPTATL